MYGAIEETRWTHVRSEKDGRPGPLPGAYDRLPADRAEDPRDRFGNIQLQGQVYELRPLLTFLRGSRRFCPSELIEHCVYPEVVEATERQTLTVWPLLSDVGWQLWRHALLPCLHLIELDYCFINVAVASQTIDMAHAVRSLGRGA